MQLNFVKMEGLGNDFMVVEWPRDLAEPEPDLVRRWGDRRLGVGFDSLLIIDRGVAGGSGPSYRVFNADGGRAQQCGNGARCIASYLACISQPCTAIHQSSTYCSRQEPMWVTPRVMARLPSWRRPRKVMQMSSRC